MNFRTLADLNTAIARNIHRLPSDIDLIVGIPRSGLLAANVIALALNKPLADLDGFVAGRTLAAGRTRRTAAHDVTIADCRRVLVVDDSIRTGAAMNEARARLAGAGIDPDRLVFCAVYVTRETSHAVDLAFEECEMPRLFEWNFMHHSYLADCCVDLDGVMCVDPTEAENDDGPCYARFLERAVPLCLPTKPVGYIVTSRLERYRAQTEDWLARHGVSYGRLIMMDLPDGATRRRLGGHARFKAEVYRAHPDKTLFIESSPRQAAEIARLSGKLVLDATGRRLFGPDPLAPVTAQQKLARWSWRAKRKLGRLRQAWAR